MTEVTLLIPNWFLYLLAFLSILYCVTTVQDVVLKTLKFKLWKATVAQMKKQMAAEFKIEP